MLSVVKNGFRIPWDPEKGRPGPVHLPNAKSCLGNEAFITKAVAEAVASGALRIVPREYLKCILPLGAVLQKGTKWRMIYDARRVNQCCLKKPFQYESLNREGRACFTGQKGIWIADLTSAFHHIQVHVDDQPYLGCEWQGVCMAWNGLCFGLSTAPWIQTILVKEIVKVWRSVYAIPCIFYIDDLSGGAPSTQGSMKNGQFAVTHLRKLGYVVQDKKVVGVNEPATSTKVLGTVVDVGCQLYRTDPDRVTRIRTSALRLLASDGSMLSRVKDKWVVQLAGLIMSATISLGGKARLRTRALYALANSRLLEGEDPRDPRTWGRWVDMSARAHEEIRWWLRHTSNKLEGQPISDVHPALQFEAGVESNASATGWGAFIGCLPGASEEALVKNILCWARGRVSIREATRQGRLGIEVFGAFRQWECIMSSTWRELTGALRAVRALGTLLRGLCIELKLDSQSAVMILGGVIPRWADKVFGGSSKAELQVLAVELFDLVESVGAFVRAVWIPRTQNTRADAVSHANEYVHSYDYHLKGAVFRDINRAWGPLSVDRFASAESTRLPRFNSRFFEPEAEWVDSLTTSWGGGELNYCFPPPRKVDQVIRKMRVDGAKGVLITFEWRGAAWFPTIFPHGRQGRPASFVKEVWMMGEAAGLLLFPTAVTPQQKTNSMPHGGILALRVDFSYAASR